MPSQTTNQLCQPIKSCLFILSATGRGLTGSGTVSVYVEDVNDNPPIFERNGTYIAHISENASVNTEVIVIKATDEDEGVNAQIM